MLIRCPECHFERDINTDAIPATATVATCPKCGNRFRFRDPHSGEPTVAQEGSPAATSPDAARSGEQAPPAPHLPTEQEGDDPLPPGAVIPKLDEGKPEEKEKPAPPLSPERPGKETPSPSGRSWFGRKKNGPAMPDPGAFPQETPDRDESRRNPDASSSMPGQEEPGGVPWERPDRYAFFPGLYHTILGVMFRPQEFFRQVGGEAPLTRPAFFYVLLSFLQIVMTRLWSMNSLKEMSETVTDPQVLAQIDGIVQSMSTPLVLLVAPFISLLQLFFFAALYHLMIRLAQPDRADFNTVVRVIAYSAAPLIFYVVPMVGGHVGSFWFVASTFIGCKYALDLSWGKTTLALAPLFLLAVPVMLILLQASLMLGPSAL